MDDPIVSFEHAKPEPLKLDAEARQHVRRYLRRVGPALLRSSRRGVPITAAQVRGAIESQKLDPSQLPWALALYCSRAEFEIESRRAAWCGDHTDMRRQIAVTFFRGDLEFDPMDLTKATGIGGPVRDGLKSPLDDPKLGLRQDYDF